MTAKKRKNQSRRRGSHTHGWGAKKKHRGSGNRGGHGFSGTGKRADSKKPSIWKDVKFFGKHGFVSKKRKELKIINISELDERVDSWIGSKLVSKDNEAYLVDLGKMGYNKLLGRGSINKKIKLTVSKISGNAKEAIINAGGEVILK